MTDNTLQLAQFAISTLFSPGPNNVLLAATGATFGLMRGLPHLFGVALGFNAMLAVVGLGLNAIFVRYPLIHEGLRIVGAAYLLYLAYRVATAGRARANAGSGRPISFFEAAAFQWVNPKAITMAIGAISAFSIPGREALPETLRIVSLFLPLAIASAGLWLAFGTLIERWLTSDRALRTFNMAMGALVALSVITLFL